MDDGALHSLGTSPLPSVTELRALASECWDACESEDRAAYCVLSYVLRQIASRFDEADGMPINVANALTSHFAEHMDGVLTGPESSQSARQLRLDIEEVLREWGG